MLGSSSWLHLLHGLVLLPCGISGKMTVTWISLLSLLCQLLRSIAMLCYLSLVYQASQIAMSASNLFHPSQQTVVWLCYRFCSAPLIALLVVGEVEDFSMLELDILGYHNISYLINAPIYLVKGGRLGLMSGVLFHSCHPSFRHTGVMFHDFASYAIG